jgi:hypothetical protein
MMQVRPVFVREAALLLAELAQKAEAGEGFVRALDGEAQGETRRHGWARGPVESRGPQPDRATGFLVHTTQPEGPERPAAPLALAAYTARLAERMVFEGPVAALSLRV